MTAQPIYEISNPSGFWRCTHSTFNDFVVGQEYPCLPDKNGGHRIHPKLHQNSWSPYWVVQKASFCYSADQLTFVFVRPFQRDEEASLVEKRDNTPAPKYPEISSPLEFQEDTPVQESPSSKWTLARLPLPKSEHIKYALFFLAGAATSALLFPLI